MVKQAFGVNPGVCTPITGRQLADLLQECKQSITHKPDLLEWRADFFESIRDCDQLLHALQELRQAAGSTPILFTIRSAAEGGNAELILSSAEKIAIYSTVCQSGCVQYIDFELFNLPNDIQQIRAISQDHGIQLILSYHNFQLTPDEHVIRDKFEQAKRYGGDIGKVAVMPNSPEDVLDFMKITSSISQQLDIPIIAISMGPLGVISRLCGWMFGSQLTFAVGENSSAPGQLPISDVRTVIDIIQKSHQI